jgi:hypothetical protein
VLTTIRSIGTPIAPEGFPESHELVCAAAELWLDDEKIKV